MDNRVINRIYTAGVFTSLILLTACGSGGDSGVSSGGSTPNTEQSSALLAKVSSSEDFFTAYKNGLDNQAQENVIDRAVTVDSPVAEADSSGDSQSGFTTTYTLEADVDEYDLVKYDGEHIFIVKAVYNYCCDSIAIETDISSDALSILPSAPDSAIRILSTDSNDATVESVGEIDLGNENVLGMYVDDGQLAVITSEYFYGAYGSVWEDSSYWNGSSFGMRVYDTDSIDNPELDWDISAQGSLVSSRRIGDTIYFVSRHTPSIPGFYYYPYTAEQRAANEAALDELILADVTPQISINGQSSDLIDPTNCYVTNEAVDQIDSAGYPVITSITAMPIDNPSAAQTLCYNENTQGIYVSDQAVYLTDSRYIDNYSTRVHKFSLDGNGIDYQGSAEVEGALWLSGQSDFRINETDGMLRLVSTSYPDDSGDRFDHHLYILEEDSQELQLNLVSQLPNETRTDEIGKPNENLYGVRFFGDRAYMVTFEQIDPLYVLDLSDPTDPFIAGELEVTGFSDFLHPVSNDLLLGLGSESAWGGRVKIELFDVSDITNPLSLSVQYIGEVEDQSYSEAQYNRHAFTYLANAEDGVDRFSLPANTWSYTSDEGYQRSTGLYLFEVNDKGTPSLASLGAIGSIEAVDIPDGQDWWYGGVSRSIFHEDSVFYVYGGYVWSALWGETDEQMGPK